MEGDVDVVGEFVFWFIRYGIFFVVDSNMIGKYDLV